MSNGPPQTWCEIDASGKIKKIDWDEVERLAERHFYLTKGVAFSAGFTDLQMGLLAVVIRGVREYVLESLERQPDWRRDR